MRPRRGLVPATALAASAAGLALAALDAGARPAVGAHDAGRSSAAAPAVKYVAGAAIPIPGEAGGPPGEGRGLAVDAAGNLYVGRTGPSTDVVVLDAQGRQLRSWRASSGNRRPALALGPDGLVYVQNDGEPYVRVYTPEGSELAGRRIQHGALSTKDIEVDGAGNVYVVARGSGSGARADDGIFRFSPSGQQTGYLVPRPGEGADEALFGLAVDADGSLWVTSHAKPALLRLDASGRPLPTFDPSLSLPGRYYDVELVDGRLHFVGALRGPAKTDHTRVASAVFSRAGERLDYAVGTLADPNRFQQAAGHGDRLLVRGLEQRSAGAFAAAGASIGVLGAVPVLAAISDGAYVHATNCVAHGSSRQPLVLTTKVFSGMRGNVPGGCGVLWSQAAPALPHCRRDTIEPRQVLLGSSELVRGRGDRALGRTGWHYASGQLTIEISNVELTSGSLLVRWDCVNASGATESRYEWKGDIEVHDPSGHVLDGRTGRPIAGATVRLEFSPSAGGPFGTPGAAGYVPPVNPQTTTADGYFGWDVAQGHWRLRISAYGYRPFTSATYYVPPEVTGLRLRLVPDPRQQATLLDLRAGRAGPVRVGSRAARRPSGLRLSVAGGRVRAITVTSRRFRTVEGVRIGTRARDLLRAYPARSSAAGLRLASGRGHAVHRAGRALVTLRNGRVTRIELRR